MEKQQPPHADKAQGTGRVSNIDGSGQTDHSRDISSIDRQEGEMNHGETGGNVTTGNPQENKPESGGRPEK